MRPVAQWVDLTVSTTMSELPSLFYQRCEVLHTSGIKPLEEAIQRNSPDFVIFDFDYPSRKAMRDVAAFKKNHPSLPMIMLTVQHSESLAIWAFRSKLLDYLIKPAPKKDLLDCFDALDSIKKAKLTQQARSMTGSEQAIPGEATSHNQQSDARLRPAISFVEAHYHAGIRNEEVAKLCDMDPFRFSRSFKQTFGIGFREFVIRYRLREARRMLANPRSTITEICFATGFNDPSYFTRTFKKHFGVNPSELLGIAMSDRYNETLSANYQPLPQINVEDYPRT